MISISLKNKFIFKVTIIFLILIYIVIYYLKPENPNYNFLNNCNSINSNKIPKKLNACIIILGRNSNLQEFITAIKKFEKNFNYKHNYPYIFFNDVEFDDQFKKEVTNYTKSLIEFEKISKKAWSVPEWIDAKTLEQSLKNNGYPIGYHHMCRFYSGFFFRERATLKYDYYIRLDTHSYVSCNIKDDPFLKFEENKNLKYGFASSVYEDNKYIRFLWENITEWILKDNIRDIIPKYNESALGFISNQKMKIDKDVCVFFNNLEIGSFSLFRNQNYLSYFEHLDKAGGFYYYRWGDAPVHTFYATLMLKKSQINLFNDILYRHHHDSNLFKNHCIYSPNGCEAKWLSVVDSK